MLWPLLDCFMANTAYFFPLALKSQTEVKKKLTEIKMNGSTQAKCKIVD